VNLIIVSIIGSGLITGSITAFNYANNIQAVALGIFALSSAIAIFPVLSEYYAKRDEKGFISTLQHTIIRVLYFVIPITILLLLLRAHIVRLLLGHGRCDWTCTITTFDTLGVLALGLVAQSLIPLFARAFYSRQNTKTPVAISLVGMVINAILSYYLSSGLGVVGIALGFVIATTVQCILLFAFLHKSFSETGKDTKQILNVFDATIVTQSFKIVLASILLGVTTYATLYIISPVVNTHTVIGIFLQAALATITGSIVYVWVTGRLNVKESLLAVSLIARAWNYLRSKTL
jgi:putative peptidoglycan lipid II flippase